MYIIFPHSIMYKKSKRKEGGYPLYPPPPKQVPSLCGKIRLTILLPDVWYGYDK